MATKYITAVRNFNGTDVNVSYLANVAEDEWMYFNDSLQFRADTDLTRVQVFYYDKNIWVDTNLIKSINGTTFDPNAPSTGAGSQAPNASVEAFVQWCINIANDPSHGYDQANRNGPNYDCSSLIWHGLNENGFNVGSYAFSTSGMPSVLSSAGWVSHSPVIVSSLQRGDILLKSGHTELYIGNQQNVGAHSNEFGGARGGRSGDQTGNEISVTNFYSGANWSSYWRYEG